MTELQAWVFETSIYLTGLTCLAMLALLAWNKAFPAKPRRKQQGRRRGQLGDFITEVLLNVMESRREVVLARGHVDPTRRAIRVGRATDVIFDSPLPVPAHAEVVITARPRVTWTRWATTS